MRTRKSTACPASPTHRRARCCAPCAQDNFLPASGALSHSAYGKIHRSYFTGDEHFSKYEKEQYSLGYEFEKRLNDVWQVRQNLRFALRQARP